jgi:hypothetical protein
MNSNGLILAHGLAALARPTSQNAPQGPCLCRGWECSPRGEPVTRVPCVLHHCEREGRSWDRACERQWMLIMVVG